MATALERIIRLQVQGDQAVRQLKKIETSTRQLDQRFAALGKNIVRFGAQLAAAFAAKFSVDQIRSAIDYGDALAKTSDKLGVTVEQLQGFRFAAEQSGVAANTLDMALQRFARRSGEAAKGTGELVKVYEELGISVRDSTGNLKSTGDLLSEFADGIKNAANPMDQLRLAFKGFDSEGAALVNMLRNGSEGLRELIIQAEEAGVVMDEETARKAEILKGRFDQMATVIKTRFTSAMVEATAAVAEFFGYFSDEERLGRAIREAAQAYADAKKKYDDSADKSPNARRGYRRQLERTKEAYEELVEELGRIAQATADLDAGPSVLSTLLDKESYQQAMSQFKEFSSVLDDEIRKLNSDKRRVLDGIYPDRVLERDIARIKEMGLAAEEEAKAISQVFERYSTLDEIDTSLIPDRRTIEDGLGDTEKVITDWQQNMLNAVKGFQTDFVNTIVDGIAEGELAFDDFAKHVLKVLAKMALDAALAPVFKAITGAITPQSNMLTASPVAGAAALLGAPTGQQMNVGVLTRPTYGYDASSGRTGQYNVNVNNYGNDEVRVEQNRNQQGGIDLDIFIEQKMAQAIAGGGLDAVAQASWGARRRGY